MSTISKGSGDTASAPRQRKSATNFRAGVWITGGGSVVSIVALFLETLLAARLLAPSEYGIYVLLVVVTNFIGMSIDFGCKTAVTQFIATSRPTEQPAVVWSALLFRGLLCLAVATLIGVGRSALIWVDPSGALTPHAIWIPAMVAALSVDQLLEAILRGFQCYKHSAVAMMLRSVLRLTLTLIFLLGLQWGMVSLIYSWILSFTLSIVYQFFMLPTRGRWGWDGSILRAMLRFGLPVQGTSFLWYGSNQVHVLLLSGWVGPASIAFFHIASKIPAALQRLAESFIAVYFPTMSSLLADKRYAAADHMLDQSLRLSSLMLGTGVLIAALFSQEIIVWLFSETYAAAASTFTILMLVFHMKFMVHLMGYTLTAAGYPARSLVENSVRATVSVAAALALIPFWGHVGAALARLLANYAADPVAIWLLRRSHIRVQLAVHVKQTALLLFAIALGWALGWFVPYMALPVAFSWLGRGVSVALFVAVNWLLTNLSLDDLVMLLPAAVTQRFTRRRLRVSHTL